MELRISLPGSPPVLSEAIIAAGVMERLAGDLEQRLRGRTAFWIWDDNVRQLWGDRLRGYGCPGLESGRVIPFPASESNKRLTRVEELARELVRAGADRGGALVAVGGGVTGDVVGFLASIYMRGIPHFQVPTTLLAQVDSSVGGKTGVDLPEGKNLLGAFHQPRTIWMDPRFFETLPDREFRQGMAEVIKTAMLGDESLWKFLEENRESIQRRDPDALLRIVASCCALKARIVEADEKEAGLRRVLNLGHTVGHALERLSDYAISHGDAVSMGMVAATALAVDLGKVPGVELSRLEKLCAGFGLPVRPPASFSPEAIIEALQTDKKKIGNTLHFILPVGIGRVMDYEDFHPGALADVLASLMRDEETDRTAGL